MGNEVAVVETIKVNLSIPSPVAGKVVEVNGELLTAPELVNQDPYGKGWLAVLEVEPDAALSVLGRQAHLGQPDQQSQPDNGRKGAPLVCRAGASSG